eukprot:CAMPEP_0198290044 /NCGR_PEP_ID=MMETSP1449-20131203/8036_1 /TAXON_ID=420275 /ORGANISM="Attheya septentrionalis, Strain CCMP2084" /LENGTH=147 /DNA_ID=CAMNT_0043988471 /DNA_START=140 /DNA_END=583 /DNA_ORIENTATION=+
MRISTETCAILCVCIGTSLLLSVQAQIGSDLDNVEEPARSLRVRVRRRNRNRNRNRNKSVVRPKIQAYTPWVCGTTSADASEKCGSTGVSIPKCEYENEDYSIEPMVKPCWAQCDGPYSAVNCTKTGEDEEVLSCQPFISGCDGFFV